MACLEIVRYRAARIRAGAFPAGLPTPPTDADGQCVFDSSGCSRFEAAYRYLRSVMSTEVGIIAPSPSRRITFEYRLQAVARLYHHIEESPGERARKIDQWRIVSRVALQARQWSPEQQDAISTIAQGCCIDDAGAHLLQQRYLYVSGEPGSGKSEVLIHAAVRAADNGCKVLVLCPTGTLVHSYRDRLPEHPNIVVETIHAGFRIYREADKLVRYFSLVRQER